MSCPESSLAAGPTFTAPRADFARVEILEHQRLARDTYRIRLKCPEIARRIVPGQFVMLRLPEGNDPLLGRPLALYDVVLDAARRPVAIDVVYLVLGRMTSRLAQFRPGQQLEIWGPLGNGFPPEAAEHLIMVAGGIGQTPFLVLAKEYLHGQLYGDPARTVPRSQRVTFCYGARSAEYLAGLDQFAATGATVRVSTDDGSQGHHGFVTHLLEATLDEHGTRGTRIVCCGPERMMEAVSEIAIGKNIPCQVSLETPMACGLGICFSCVARVRDADGGWDYRRTCVEGPIFDARQIVF